MNKEIIKNYIEKAPIKVVNTFDLENRKIEYIGIKQNKTITVIDGDEELTRAYILTHLVNDLGYPANRIEIEHEYTAGRPHTNTSYCDIIVRDEKGDAFLFFEVKSPDAYNSIDKDNTIKEQLYKVAFQEKAEKHDVKYLILYTIKESQDKIYDECMIIDMHQYPTYEDYEAVRNTLNEIPSRYNRAQSKPYKKGSDKDLEKNFSIEMIHQLQKNLHNVLWGGGGTDDNEVFISLTNLILAKIQDEGTTENNQDYRFQSFTYEKDGIEEFETNEELFERINNLYREALKSKLNVLNKTELEKSYVIDTKKFSLAKLKYAVQQIEGLSFVDGKNSLSGKDILGDFFEGIIRNGFKQSKGQFFTHINIVKFMIWATQTDKLAIERIKKDKEIPYMIDPSAGSGTFLIEYMKFITENMKYRFRNLLGSARDVNDKIESDWFYPNHRENKWAQTFIYATENNFNLGTATKVNMILHGDGSTNIFVKDGLLPFTNYEKETGSFNVMHDSSKDSLYDDKYVNGNFDLIFSNPPFSIELDNDTKKTIKNSFMFGSKKNSENLFIERWYQLLRENGRLAAVLPESVFDTTENLYIRLFIFKYFKVRAVVSIPQTAFEPFTNTKTSLLFAQKKTKKEIESWNSAWDKYSKEFVKIKTRVQNLMDVYFDKKARNSLPSIKDMTESEEINCIKRFLKYSIMEEDSNLSTEELLNKYSDEINELCYIEKDKEITNAFGFANSWWVFGEVTKEINNDIFMCEVDNIGYKRTKRGEKETENDLFHLEYAPDRINIDEINEYYNTTIAYNEELLDNLTKKNNNEINKSKIEKLRRIIDDLKKELTDTESFIGKYYDSNGVLKAEYSERDNKELVDRFKYGNLRKYCSFRVLIHKELHDCVLDYMRDIQWD